MGQHNKYGVKVIQSRKFETPDVFTNRYKPVEKSDKPEQITNTNLTNASEWIYSPIDQRGLKVLVDDSTILPQCIRAYANNIAGFGLNVKYNDDYDEESDEMTTEFDLLKKTLALLNMDMQTKELFEKIITSRETYGIAYAEVIRDIDGHVIEMDFIIDTPTITKTYPMEPYIETPYFYKGEQMTRKKMFRKYKQELNGKTVYFKEFGDPRTMNKHNGLYVVDNKLVTSDQRDSQSDPVELQDQANEIIEFALGEMPYGEVRWIGQVLTVDGNRRAEILNNNYFRLGRHTPLMIIIKNGTLSSESETALQTYMDDIRGEAGQHSFLLLEAQNDETTTDFEGKEKPDVEIKDLASILQKDELFQDYEENGRKKVQSAFLLPDLYVGYTKDFNRATAQAAMEVTEKQVFQPERIALAWIINNKLLNDYGFKYVEAYFESPDITNPDDIRGILAVTNQAGGLTPNVAKELTYKTLGKDNCEDYEGDWGDTPIAVQNRISSEKNAAVTAQENAAALNNLNGQKQPDSAVSKPTEATDKQPQNPPKKTGTKAAEDAQNADVTESAKVTADDLKGMDKQIKKAAEDGRDDLIPIMKEIRKALREYREGK